MAADEDDAPPGPLVQRGVLSLERKYSRGGAGDWQSPASGAASLNRFPYLGGDIDAVEALEFLNAGRRGQVDFG